MEYFALFFFGGFADALYGRFRLFVESRRATDGDRTFWETCGNDGDLDLVFLELVVADRTEYDLGFWVDGLSDDFGGVLDLEHSEIFATCNGE